VKESEGFPDRKTGTEVCGVLNGTPFFLLMNELVTRSVAAILQERVKTHRKNSSPCV
jgi:hypothetical protein